MSEFDTQLDLLRDMMLQRGEALRRQASRQWSTSMSESYEDLMEKLSTEAQNTDFLKLYAKDKSAEESASISIQAALRAQIQFVATLRRAFRMKMVASDQSREYSSVDHDRYAYNDLAVLLSKLQKLKDSADINPDDSVISNATGESSDG